MFAFSGHVSSFPYQYLAISSVQPLRAATTHASQTSPLPTTTLFPLSTAPTPTLLTTTSTPPTNYRLTKTKTDKLMQRLAEFSYMHAYHSFQSELSSGCLERKSGIVQSLSSASSLFRIADP